MASPAAAPSTASDQKQAPSTGSSAPATTPPSTPPTDPAPPPAGAPPPATATPPPTATPPTTPPTSEPPSRPAQAPVAPPPRGATPTTAPSVAPVSAPPPSPPDSPPPPDPSPPPGAIQSSPPPLSTPSPPTGSAPQNSYPTIPPPPFHSAPAPAPSKAQDSNVLLLAGSVGGALVGALLLLSIFFCFCLKKRRRDPYRQPTPGKGDGGRPITPSTEPYQGGSLGRQSVGQSAYSMGSDYGTATGTTTPATIPPPPMSQASSLTTSRSFFTYDELEKATDGFSSKNVLGEGGFGRVYKGKLENGQVVAVKQLTLGGGQGEREFRAEVEIISRVHHKHLVSLVGYCIANDQRLLVYEFVPNGTLEAALHDKRNPVLDWPTRQRIAIGAARGLAYLHEDSKPRIIHRDIKASNILLDENFDAEVADFGLAKILNKGPDMQTHVTTRVMGTFGYLAPEYAMSGKLTEKSDVYSFGVVLLELVSGRKPVDTSQPPGQESLVEWARPLLNTDDVSHVVDPELEGQYNPSEMQRMMIAAALCVRATAQTRPKMSQVVRMLEDDDIEALLKSRPGYSRAFEDMAPFGGIGSQGLDYDGAQFSADMRYQQNYSGSTQGYGGGGQGYGGGPQHYSGGSGGWNDAASQGSRDDDYQTTDSGEHVPYYPGRAGLGAQNRQGSYGRPQQSPYSYGSQAGDPRLQAARNQIFPPAVQSSFPPRPRPANPPQQYSSGSGAYSGTETSEYEESDVGGFAPPPRPPGLDSAELNRLTQNPRRNQQLGYGEPSTVMSMRPPYEGR